MAFPGLKILTASIFITILASILAFAGVPQTINYQGYLRDGSGAPVNKTVSMTFGIYSSASAPVAALWTETQNTVPVANGIYSVSLGSVNIITLPFNKPYWLGVAVETDLEMVPRTALSSVGYAFRSKETDSAGQLSLACTDGGILIYKSGAWQCGTVTTLPNAAATCVDASCTISMCSPGYGDCNKLIPDGCEVNTNTNLANCGACGSSCPTLSNMSSSCNAGICTAGACISGWLDCNSNSADGCEINPNTDASNCGLCGKVCSAQNITPSCSGGNCNGTCNSGYADCDSNKQTNGCETNITNNVSNCGSCGIVCSSQNITPSCFGGNCNGTCNSGYADCDSNKQTNGCETNITNNVSNCGACGTVCSSQANAVSGCVNGTCVISTCNAGYADCNSNSADGCETNTGTNANNCGACGIVCSAQNITSSCSAGTCNGVCNSGYADCDGNKQANGCETHTNTNISNCGACGIVCSSNNIANPSCSSGQCNGTCNTGYADCNGNRQVDGCEINVLADPNNCGACGTICSSNNGTPVCSAGGCGIVCSSDYANCDNDSSNGCETYLKFNNNNCGACGHACVSGNHCNVSGICVAGSCTDADGDGYCTEQLAE